MRIAMGQHVDRGRIVRFVLFVLAVATLIVPIAGGRAEAAPSGASRSGFLVPVYAGPSDGTSTQVGSDVTPRATRAAATIQVTYSGFPANAKAAFQKAVDTWETKLESNIVIRVTARWRNLGGGTLLGFAGPITFHRDFDGALKSNRWYPSALASKLFGSDINGSQADILADLNSAYPSWYYGTSGPTPVDKIDLQTTVLHELAHGLGFGFGFYQDGNAVRWDPINGGDNRALVGGTFVVNNANTQLISFPNGSNQLKTASTNNMVFWSGAKGRAANGGNRPRLFAPNPFQPGSSISHLDEATYPKGTVNALLTPVIQKGERLTTPGGIAVGVLQDQGWTAAK